jgi:PPP family 3-phenylpropionic acid transporter
MLGSLASGPIWQHYGAGVLYTCSAVMGLLGLLLMLWKPGIAGERQPG